MKIIATENKVSKKTGNVYEVVILDNGLCGLRPEWLRAETKLPLEVDLILKSYGQWTLAPFL